MLEMRKLGFGTHILVYNCISWFCWRKGRAD